MNVRVKESVGGRFNKWEGGRMGRWEKGWRKGV